MMDPGNRDDNRFPRIPLAHQATGRERPATRYSTVPGGPRLNGRRDEEQNRLSARAARYVRVGTNVGAVAARVAGQRVVGLGPRAGQNTPGAAAPARGA